MRASGLRQIERSSRRGRSRSRAERFRASPRYRALIREWALDLVGFGRALIPEATELPSPPFHYEIAERLTDYSVSKQVEIAPRGFAKSTLVACVFVFHHLFLEHVARYLKGYADSLERQPVFVVIQSKTLSESKRRLRTIKEVLEAPRTRFFFGDWGPGTARRWTEEEIILKDGSIILAVGTGQQVRGLKEGHLRPTLALLDDPEDEENTKTAERMEANLRKLLQGLVRSLDRTRGRVVVIGTPLHERCMVEELLKMDDWVGKRYQATLSQEGGESLWPELWSREELNRERLALEAQGRASIYYQEMECVVIGDEERLFTTWHYWDGHLEVGPSNLHTLHVTALSSKPKGSLERLAEPKVLPVFVYMGIDPASSTSRRADRSAIVAVAIDSDNNRYVLPYFLGRRPPLEVAKRVVSYHNRYRPLKTRVETVGYQEMLYDFLRSGEVGRIRGLVGEKTRTAKSARLERMEPWFSSGRVFLRPDMTELIDELQLYPRGRHDDLLDALDYAMHGAHPPSGDHSTSASSGGTSSPRRPVHWMLT